jgi:hypothetical protein
MLKLSHALGFVEDAAGRDSADGTRRFILPLT